MNLKQKPVNFSDVCQRFQTANRILMVGLFDPTLIQVVPKYKIADISREGITLYSINTPSTKQFYSFVDFDSQHFYEVK